MEHIQELSSLEKEWKHTQEQINTSEKMKQVALEK